MGEFFRFARDAGHLGIKEFFQRPLGKVGLLVRDFEGEQVRAPKKHCAENDRSGAAAREAQELGGFCLP